MVKESIGGTSRGQQLRNSIPGEWFSAVLYPSTYCIYSLLMPHHHTRQCFVSANHDMAASGPLRVPVCLPKTHSPRACRWVGRRPRSIMDNAQPGVT